MKQRAKSLKRLVDYRFLNPAGHFGFIAVTFFVTLPFTQVIVNFLVVDFALAVGLGKGVAVGTGVAVGVGEALAAASILNCSATKSSASLMMSR